MSKLKSDGQIIAGGTDILRDIRLGLKTPKVLVSLDRTTELHGISQQKEAIVIGPLTTMAELAGTESIKNHIPALAEAAAGMGSAQVRNRATFGGNLCNARPCADTAPPAFVCDASLILNSVRGSRQVAADEFMTAPGQTVIENDEILTQIVLPTLPAYTGSAFMNVTNRKAVEITITSAAARLTLESEKGPILEAKICLGSVAPTPISAQNAQSALIGKEPSEEVFQAAAAAAVSDCTPIDDLRGSADYRNWMVEVLVKRVLDKSLERARETA
jgi:carbon-monoxide dehydrogenase medium subunit